MQKLGLYPEIVTLKPIVFLLYTKLTCTVVVHNCYIKHTNLIPLNVIETCTYKVLFKISNPSLVFHFPYF